MRWRASRAPLRGRGRVGPNSLTVRGLLLLLLVVFLVVLLVVLLVVGPNDDDHRCEHYKDKNSAPVTSWELISRLAFRILGPRRASKPAGAS